MPHTRCEPGPWLCAKSRSHQTRLTAAADENRTCTGAIGLRQLWTGTGSVRVRRRGTCGVPPASYPNEPRRDAGHVRAQALLDRPPPHWRAEESLDGAMHVASPHRFFPLRKDTEYRLQHPVVPTVPGPDWRNRLLGGAAIGAIFGTRMLEATI
jgi:hypothetical protein